MTVPSEYVNTDLDLKSEVSFDALKRELDETYPVLHYTHGQDGRWHASIESSQTNDSTVRDAAMDVGAMIDAIHALSPAAKAEFDGCYLREFNLGFDCGDTWAYSHTLPVTMVRKVAEVGGSIAVTLYPVRRCEGKQDNAANSPKQ